jgi:hypothetical protein
MRTHCVRCERPTAPDDFAFRYDKGIKRRRGYCKECYKKVINKSLARPEYKKRYNARRRERRLEKAKYLFDYLAAHECACGESNPFVLQFDHVRDTKLFNLSAEIREKSFEAIVAEVAKCDVICGNCHMRKTRRHGKIWTESYQNKPWLLKKRQRIRNYLLSHPCVDCGELDPTVLEFDHVRGEKLFTISVNFCDRRWELIELEIAKCDIRCTNCHLVRTIATSDNTQWYKVQMYEALQGV